MSIWHLDCWARGGRGNLSCHWHVAMWSVLRQLHWLPVCQRNHFKIAGWVFQALTGQAPAYLADECRLISDSDGRRLLSSDVRTCVTPRTSTRFGDRSFSAAGRHIWNGLPSALRAWDLNGLPSALRAWDLNGLPSALRAWDLNGLPSALRAWDLTFDCFKRGLKTYPFTLVWWDYYYYYYKRKI